MCYGDGSMTATQAGQDNTSVGVNALQNVDIEIIIVVLDMLVTHN